MCKYILSIYTYIHPVNTVCIVCNIHTWVLLGFYSERCRGGGMAGWETEMINRPHASYLPRARTSFYLLSSLFRFVLCFFPRVFKTFPPLPAPSQFFQRNDTFSLTRVYSICHRKLNCHPTWIYEVQLWQNTRVRSVFTLPRGPATIVRAACMSI